jgi:hypothetical protein
VLSSGPNPVTPNPGYGSGSSASGYTALAGGSGVVIIRYLT